MHWAKNKNDNFYISSILTSIKIEWVELYAK